MVNAENTCRISRSELWHKIYKIVSQIPREDTISDSMDYPSCATEIEFLFLEEINKTNKYAEV